MLHSHLILHLALAGVPQCTLSLVPLSSKVSKSQFKDRIICNLCPIDRTLASVSGCRFYASLALVHPWTRWSSSLCCGSCLLIPMFLLLPSIRQPPACLLLLGEQLFGSMLKQCNSSEKKRVPSLLAFSTRKHRIPHWYIRAKGDGGSMDVRFNLSHCNPMHIQFY